MGTIALVAIVVGVGGLVGVSWFAQRTIRRQLAALAGSSCPSCGNVFGAAIASGARQQYLAACDEKRKANPNLRINFEREWQVVCPQCRTKVRFQFETGSLVASAA